MKVEELKKQYIQIPQEIKNVRRWICYKIVTNADGEQTKVPMNALTGGYAKSNDSLTWTSFDLAILGCVKYNFVGLGFMLGLDNKTGITYFGVDLDNHVNKKTGKKPYEKKEDFERFYSEFVTKLNSYTEYSHSLEGVHIICKGTLPEGARKHANVEMYDKGRFFTMTGKVINNVPIKDCEKEVVPLWEKYLNVKEEEAETNFVPTSRPAQLEGVVNENGSVTFMETIVSERTPTNLNDDEIINKIRNSQYAQEFINLYNGNTSKYGGDHSSADLALCKILAFWTGCDIYQIDRIFRSSGLMREKWNQKRSATNRHGVALSAGTYGSQTIEYAIANQQDIYTPKKEKTITYINETKKSANNSGLPIAPKGDIVKFNELNDPEISVKQIFKNYSLTDTGNAERFYDYFGEFFRYNATNKNFLFWNGKTWIGDSKTYIKKYADKLIEVLKDEAIRTEKKINELSAEEEPDMNKIKFYQALNKSQMENIKKVSNKAGKEAMLSELQHLHEIAVVNDELDTHPMLLNTDSGVVNLETGDVMPFDKKYMLSKNTNTLVSFEEPKTWKKFLHDIFKRPNEKETQEIIDCIQMALGESLTGRSNKDHLFILYGDGSNGKSTFVQTIKTVFGDYGKVMNSAILIQSHNASAQSNEFSLSALLGARFVSMSETNKNEKMNDKIVKSMTSGEEIAAQFKYGQPFSFRPTFSPWMSTNNLPAIRSKDYGIWRRIFLIPFVNKFTDETKDIHMPEKLAKEMPQILGWMIQGNLRLIKEFNGILLKPRCIEDTLSTYKKNSDSINLYLEEHCMTFPGYRTSTVTLFANYKNWALTNNEYLYSESEFKNDMIQHGYEVKKDPNVGQVYIGIKLNTDTKGHVFGDDEGELE